MRLLLFSLFLASWLFIRNLMASISFTMEDTCGCCGGTSSCCCDYTVLPPRPSINLNIVLQSGSSPSPDPFTGNYTLFITSEPLGCPVWSITYTPASMPGCSITFTVDCCDNCVTSGDILSITANGSSVGTTGVAGFTCTPSIGFTFNIPGGGGITICGHFILGVWLCTVS